MRTRTALPFAAIVLAVPLQASAAPADGWAPWYGCWRAEAVGAEAAPLVCVLPGDEPTTVRIATIENDVIVDETVVRADGVARPIEEGGCSGTERAFFSSDGRRVFTRAELACTGLGRASTGVLAMLSGSEWMDAQALTVNNQHAARAIRYRAAAPEEIPSWVDAELPQDQRLAQEAARLDAASPLDIAAVVEASRNVAAPAVEALLGARAQEFALTADRLIQLQDQGVPASTIDMMVAVSFPSRFIVAQNTTPRPAADLLDEDLMRSFDVFDDCYDRYRTSSRYRRECYDAYGFGYGYGSFGYGSYGRFGYSPYGYDRYGWNYSRPVYVIVPPRADQEPTGGTIVKGRGYRRSGTATGTPSRRADDNVRTSSSSSSSSARSTSPPASTTKSTPPPRKAKRRGGGGE